MSSHMPQEIEVWYVLPALRRELAKIFIADHRLTQKESAKILGLTESAISQYLKSKRAQEVIFSSEDLQKIKETAKKILEERENANQHFYQLTVAFRGSKTMCDLHRKMDSCIPDDCTICKEELVTIK